VLATKADFETAILENPDDDAPYLVYADWLMAQGDPRGELIVMQHDADEAEGKRKTALRKAAAAHFEAHAATFLGPLQAFTNGTYKAVWRYGYVRRLELQWNDNGRWPHTKQAFDELTAVLRHPSYEFIIELQLGPISDRYYDEQFQETIDLLADLRRPAALRTLDLGIYGYQHVDTGFGELSELVAALPRLKRIRLRERQGDQPRPDDPLQEMMIKRSRA